MSIELTQAQIDAYHQDGYLALPSLTSLEEVERMRESYDRIFNLRSGREVGDQFDLAGSDEDGTVAKLPQILGPSKYAPELGQTELLKNARRVVEQLLGPEAEYGGDHAILKPARIGAETPWHQDEAYWDPAMEYNSLSIWVPLQEANLENGCMWFVPGSHRLPVLPHRPIGGDPRVHGLELLEVDTTHAVACPLPPGGATIHHNATLHYTGPNRSEIDRRAYIMIFGLPAKERPDPRSFPWKDMRSTLREERARGSIG